MTKFKISITIISLFMVFSSNAAISLDRTRIIFNGSDKSVSLNIANENKQLPYLAQAWLENDRHEKITTGPLVVTPPVQRIDAGVKSQLRLMSTPEINLLPKDRETLFYFNLREIPPRSEKANTLQIALQTQVKLFYRPEAIKAAPNKVWQSDIILRPKSDGYMVHNPTPYYITVIGFGATRDEAKNEKFEAVMLSPKSDILIKTKRVMNPWLTFIDDYGGRPTLSFQCRDSQCTNSDKG